MEQVKKVRVLHCIGKMNCGGAETMLMNIYRHINKEEIQFDFLVHAEGEGYYDEEISKLGGNIFYIPSQGTLGIKNYIKTLKKFLKETGPFDIVHSHLDWQGGLITVAARLAGVKKVIVHSHTSKLMHTSLSYKVLLRLQKLCIGLFATDYWACSDEASQFLFYPLLCTASKKKVIPNAIDLERYKGIDREKMRKALGVDKDTLLLGHVGSLSPFKNQLFLIEVAKELQKQQVKFKLILVGGGQEEYRQQVKEKIENYQLGTKVELLGLREDIPSMMTALDIFLFPSIFEGLGIVAIEAQAGGTPCIVSEGVPKEVDMQLGLTTWAENEKVDDWVMEIFRVAEQTQVSQERINEAIGRKNYDIKKVVVQIEASYI